MAKTKKGETKATETEATTPEASAAAPELPGAESPAEEDLPVESTDEPTEAPLEGAAPPEETSEPELEVEVEPDIEAEVDELLKLRADREGTYEVLEDGMYCRNGSFYALRRGARVSAEQYDMEAILHGQKTGRLVLRKVEG